MCKQNHNHINPATEGQHENQIQSSKEGNNKVMKKLLIVLILALIFMIAEIVGGILADSIAIMSDAAHMFSDLLGFAISIVSVWISGFPANKKFSYGYHRAGVLGALTSVLVIWILTGFLIYFAVLRMIHIDKIEVHGKIMFGVAIFGLFTNLLMVKVLHGGHSHTHDDKHDHKSDDHLNEKDKKTSVEGQKHEEEQNHHHAESEHKRDYENDHHAAHDPRHNCGPEHHHYQIDSKEQNEMVQGEQKSKESHKDDKKSVAITINDNKKLNAEEDVKECCDKISSSDKVEKGTKAKSLSNIADKDNLNIRATIIHILGDIFQSIGVVIASILIWINPQKLKIADPIITFIFGIIILFTTVKIMRDCIYVLMEGTPMELNVSEFEEKIKSVEGVDEVHDLHVWSAGVGKPVMSVHIHSEGEKKSLLNKVKEVCQKYGISHSTIQIEMIRDKTDKDHISCINNIH